MATQLPDNLCLGKQVCLQDETDGEHRVVSQIKHSPRLVGRNIGEQIAKVADRNDDTVQWSEKDPQC